MKIFEAFANWKAEVMPAVIEQYGRDDLPALNESWNDYTDALCKDGDLTDLQYRYCPSWDDVTFDDDQEEFAFLLDAMGVTANFHTVLKRPDGYMDDMPVGTRHWKFYVKRGADIIEGHWSAGPAIATDPEAADVLHSLLMDTSSVDQDFEDWASDYGYDTDSRKAERIYNACKKTLDDLQRMFSASELSDLRTAAEDL